MASKFKIAKVLLTASGTYVLRRTSSKHPEKAEI
jgi:hypothetical protein